MSDTKSIRGTNQTAFLSDSEFAPMMTMPKGMLAEVSTGTEQDPSLKQVTAGNDSINYDDNRSCLTAEESSVEIAERVSHNVGSSTTKMTDAEATAHLDSEKEPTAEFISVRLARKDFAPKDTAYGDKEAMVPHFFRVSQEVRYIVYECFFPSAATINLTDGYSIPASENSKVASYAWSKDASNLRLSCCKVYNEIAALFFRTNIFVLTPWEMNFKYHKLAPHSNTEFWLTAMRPSTKIMVKKLHVYLPIPFLPHRVGKIAEGLAHFPEVEIAVMPLSTTPEPKRSEYRRSFETLCQVIEAGRVHTRRILWNDGGDVEVAYMLSSLPGGLLMRRPTAFEVQAQKGAHKQS